MCIRARNFSKTRRFLTSTSVQLSCEDNQSEIDAIRKRTQRSSEILYGVQPVLGALHYRQRTPFQLLLKSEILDLSREEITAKNPWIADIIDLAKRLCIPMNRVSRDFLSAVTNGRSHQNVALECSHFPFSALSNQSLLSLLHFPHCPFHRASLACCGSSGIILLLDQIQDVMNFGSILRSAVFFGLPTVLVSSNSALPSPLISKLSAGAMESMRFHRVPDIKSTLKAFSLSGFGIVGTAGRQSDLSEDSGLRPPLDLSVVKPEMVGGSSSVSSMQPLILALGSELSGLSPTVFSACNLVVRIPGVVDASRASLSHGLKQSPLPTSLNVAAATGILLYKLKSLRQNRSLDNRL